MQFALIGYDGKDPEALARRMASREAHLAMCKKLKDSGNYICGGALLDDNDQMIGSMIFYEFDSREAMDAWMPEEPYIQGNVWQSIEIKPIRIPKH